MHVRVCVGMFASLQEIGKKNILWVYLVPHFTLKNFGFWSIILHNGTKHRVKFLTKRYPFSILDFSLKRQKKKPKNKKLSPIL
jgi:hypothetical protein